MGLSSLWIMAAPLWIVALGLLWLASELRLLRCGQVQPGFWKLLRESLDTLALRNTQARQLARREAAKTQAIAPRYLD